MEIESYLLNMSGWLTRYFICFIGNCLQISPESMRRYDRLYCGAGCPEEVISYMKEMIHVGGIGVVPCGEQVCFVLFCHYILE